MRKREYHGKANTSEYHTWEAMIQRCTNVNHKNYHRYGGRGITICDRWLNSFINFYNDMGKRPFIKAQIDRIDNNGNYILDNCRWVKPSENTQNTSKAKLTITIANIIREEYKTDKLTHRSLGLKYSIDHRTIGRIINNQAW